jgi:multiple sugar transport system permease protein
VKATTRTALLLLLPSAAAIIVVVVYPLLYAFYLAVHEVPLFGGETRYVGLAHFARLLTAREFWADFGRTAVFTVGSVAMQMLVGVGLALLLNELGAGRNTLRGLLLAPYVLPTVVVALLWRWLLNDLYGLVPYLVRLVGLHSPLWLASPFWALTTVTIINGWMFFPFVLLVVMARIESIPPSLYEAASIDGAGVLARFAHVTLPQLREVVIVAGLLRGIWMFNKFDSIWLVTAGGPAGATETLPILGYFAGFARMDLGAGAAVGTMIFAVISIVTIVYLRFLALEEA